MSHFKANAGGGDERLFISWSADGFNWTCLNNGLPVWQPPGWEGFWNVVRDPSIIFANGHYWVAFTSGNDGKGTKFGLVKSTDLLNWTFVASVDVTLPGATDQLTWNPVFFEEGDGSIRATIAISPVGGSQYNCVPHMKVHEIHPINADWTQWSRVDVSAVGEMKIGSGPWVRSAPDAIIESSSLLTNGTTRYHLRSATAIGNEPILFRYSATLNSLAAPTILPIGKPTGIKRLRNLRASRR